MIHMESKMKLFKIGTHIASIEVSGRKVPKRYVDLEAEICGAATSLFPVGSDSWAIYVRFHMLAAESDALLESFTLRNSQLELSRAGKGTDYANLARAIQYELEISEDI